MTVATLVSEIVDDNDFVATVGPVRGRSSTDGKTELYHGDDVVAFIASAHNSNTPIGGLTLDCEEVGTTAKYMVFFAGSSITVALASLADGTIVYLIVRATTGTFRRWKKLTYKKTTSG